MVGFVQAMALPRTIALVKDVFAPLPGLDARITVAALNISSCNELRPARYDALLAQLVVPSVAALAQDLQRVVMHLSCCPCSTFWPASHLNAAIAITFEYMYSQSKRQSSSPRQGDSAQSSYSYSY